MNHPRGKGSELDHACVVLAVRHFFLSSPEYVHNSNEEYERSVQMIPSRPVFILII